MLYYTKRFIIIASAVISTIIVIAYSYVFKDKKFEFTAKINENIIQNIQQEEKIINKSKEEKWAIKIPSINLEAPIKEGTTDEILNQYVGVGKYVEYLIEYRLPRAFITSENIKEILYYEPIEYSTLAEARLKYAASFSPTKEADQEAHALIKEKKLVFNEDKWL